MSTLIPLNGKFKITYPYGVKDSRYKSGFHTGIDLVPLDNKIIYSPCIGKVKFHNYDIKTGYGNYVVIEDDEGYNHYLCHLSEIYKNVRIGNRVTLNTKIGVVGMTGNATGIHLHYEIRKKSNKYADVINPCLRMKIPNSKGVYYTQNYQVEGNKNSILVNFTGIWDKTIYYVKYKNQAFWVNKEDIINSDINYIELSTKKFKYCGSERISEEGKIEKLVEYANQQFWV